MSKILLMLDFGFITIGTAVIACIACHEALEAADYEGRVSGIRIRYKEFLRYYSLDPASWTLRTNYALKDNHYKITFSMCGTIQYKYWKFSQKRIERKTSRIKERCKFLEEMQNEAYPATEQTFNSSKSIKETKGGKG